MADIKTRDVRYVNKDYDSLKKSFIDLSKIYFPDTYSDLSEASLGMMIIGMTAYVGDVLSYNMDTIVQESLLTQAVERKNLIELAYAWGYKYRTTYPAVTTVDVYQLLPAIGTGNNIGPDWRYALTLSPNATLKTDDSAATAFRTLDYVHFGISGSNDATDVTVYELDADKNPAYYMIKKSVRASAGSIKSISIAVDDPVQFRVITIPDNSVIEIIDVIDSDGNNWYEVFSLAQDVVFEDIPNIIDNDDELYIYNTSTPRLLKMKKISKRFEARNNADGYMELRFGPGVSEEADDVIIPNPKNIGTALSGLNTITDQSIDPSSFLYTKTYGQAPYRTTLTIRYVTGGGTTSNTDSNKITKLSTADFRLDSDGLDSEMVNYVKESVAVNNPIPATGGRDGDTNDEIRQNAILEFGSQRRAVTMPDYILRAVSLPPKYGSVQKVYITQDDVINAIGSRSDIEKNPNGLNLYCLGYDINKRLSPLNSAVKQNLKVYLTNYRMLTDSVNIKDAYIINIGVKFEIQAYSGISKKEVLLRCIDAVKSYFEIDKWQINQPILISDLEKNVLASVDGVQSVIKVEIVNLYDVGSGYSGNLYDITSATKDNVVYPSLDPSCFEIKYPNRDIIGNCR